MHRLSHQARIASRSGDMFLSADTAYDLEVVFDHVRVDSHHHQRLRLELDAHSYIVQPPPGGPASRCSHCHGPLGKLAYTQRLATACERCVRTENAPT